MGPETIFLVPRDLAFDEVMIHRRRILLILDHQITTSGMIQVAHSKCTPTLWAWDDLIGLFRASESHHLSRSYRRSLLARSSASDSMAANLSQ